MQPRHVSSSWRSSELMRTTWIGEINFEHSSRNKSRRHWFTLSAMAREPWVASGGFWWLLVASGGFRWLLDLPEARYHVRRISAHISHSPRRSRMARSIRAILLIAGASLACTLAA